MMSSNSSGKKLEGFFTGKGFYIVLFLCAAVIGVSAWMMADGNETMNGTSSTGSAGMENRRVETIIISPDSGTDSQSVMAERQPDVGVAAVDEETPVLDSQDESLTQVWHEGDVMEVAAPLYVWPIQGALERLHSMDALAYDVTMRDWRTHEGVDIAAALGSTVTASHSGRVESIENDELYGTMVTVNHGDGSSSRYANLSDTVMVNVGDWLECGAAIGTVGTSALCEIGQGAHLHFALYVDGQSVDPLEYLPA